MSFNVTRYIIVIKTFADRSTQALFAGRCPARWRSIRAVAERKLAMLDAAESLEFLRSPPGNRLKKLHGPRSAMYSIRINEQWRLCFRWDGDAYDVEIVDYH